MYVAGAVGEEAVSFFVSDVLAALKEAAGSVAGEAGRVAGEQGAALVERVDLMMSCLEELARISSAHSHPRRAAGSKAAAALRHLKLACLDKASETATRMRSMPPACALCHLLCHPHALYATRMRLLCC